MKPTETHTKPSLNMKVNPELDKLPFPEWAKEKAEKAAEFLKKHPIPVKPGNA